MKRWAVGFISYSDNELIVELVLAPTWEDAILNHSHIGDSFTDNVKETLEETKQSFFDCDAAVDVKEIS